MAEQAGNPEALSPLEEKDVSAARPQEGKPVTQERDFAKEELQKRRQRMIEAAAKGQHRPPKGWKNGPRPAPQEEYDGEPGYGPRHRHRRHRAINWLMWRLAGVLTLLIVLIVLVGIFYPRVKNAVTVPNLSITVPSSLDELKPDPVMGYNKIDFTNAILGESRLRQELIVLEQDVQVTTQVSQALANIALFAKTQTLVSYGTGVYTVDLQGIDESAILVDENLQLVTMTLPHATLQYIDFDVTKTESGETRKALLAFGDIKLTAEQDLELKTIIHSTMEERLGTPAMLTKADEAALQKVSEIFSPLIYAVSPDFLFKAVME